jgi:hypothetical protein
MKTKGPVTEKEHTTFLNFWLEHFIFCGPSLAPTKNYLSLAYELARGTQLGIGKLFLGEVYRYLQLMSVNLFSQKTVKKVVPGGLFSYGLSCISRIASRTSHLWPPAPFQILMGSQFDAPAMARLCIAFRVVN